MIRLITIPIEKSFVGSTSFRTAMAIEYMLQELGFAVVHKDIHEITKAAARSQEKSNAICEAMDGLSGIIHHSADHVKDVVSSHSVRSIYSLGDDTTFELGVVVAEQDSRIFLRFCGGITPNGYMALHRACTQGVTEVTVKIDYFNHKSLWENHQGGICHMYRRVAEDAVIVINKLACVGHVLESGLELGYVHAATALLAEQVARTEAFQRMSNLEQAISMLREKRERVT